MCLYELNARNTTAKTILRLLGIPSVPPLGFLFRKPARSPKRTTSSRSMLSWVVVLEINLHSADDDTSEHPVSMLRIPAVRSHMFPVGAPSRAAAFASPSAMVLCCRGTCQNPIFKSCPPSSTARASSSRRNRSKFAGFTPRLFRRLFSYIMFRGISTSDSTSSVYIMYLLSMKATIPSSP